MDFWKAMLSAQLFISIVYIFFGAFVSLSYFRHANNSALMIFQTYSYYGQYAYVSITQVVQPLSLQILSNVLALITGWLAVCEFLIDPDNVFQWANERFSSPVL
jgi:hypothetical protein